MVLVNNGKLKYFRMRRNYFGNKKLGLYYF